MNSKKSNKQDNEMRKTMQDVKEFNKDIEILKKLNCKPKNENLNNSNKKLS
jgi:hypothetical protein